MKSNKKGFSFIEVTLVLAVSTVIGFLAFSQFIKEQDYLKAKYSGEQIKQIGDAVNAYISNHYDTLSTLTNATGATLDIGPRTCTVGLGSCSISISTLLNEGLLNSSFVGKNVYGSGYSILLKRTGISPYYKINGIVITDTPLKTGDNIRYDLLGVAMKSAGIDSGMTRDSSSLVSGFNGAWNAGSSDYSVINKSGLLAYQAGYGTYNYSVFLRRDGTLPMTGDLNMGSNNINSLNNVTANGTITTNNLRTRGAAVMDSTLTVSGNATFASNISVKGADIEDVPPGYIGGIRTPDVYAHGGLFISKLGTKVADKNWAFMANRDGYLGISGNMNAEGTITAKGFISAGREVIARNSAGDAIHLGGYDGNDFELKLDNSDKMLTIWWADLYQQQDVYRDRTILQTWGSAYIDGDLRTSRNIFASGNIMASSIQTSGRITTNEFLQIGGVATLGATCPNNGLQGRTSAGAILSCVSGKWSTAGFTSFVSATGASKCNSTSGQSIAYCPAGYKLISGGHMQTSVVNELGKNAPDSSYPDPSINAWRVSLPTSAGTCMAAYALCAQ